MALEKQLRLLHGRDAVVLTYTLWGGGSAGELELRPLLAMRPIHELMFQWNARLAAGRQSDKQYRVPPTHRTPEVFFSHAGEFDAEPLWYLNTLYRREQERGYAGLEDLWSPGAARFKLSPGQSCHWVCSADPLNVEEAVRLADAQFASKVSSPPPPPPAPPAPAVGSGAAASAGADLELLRGAAAIFVVGTRRDGAADRETACISDYPWPRPSGRDVLIAFPGLFLATGRFEEARSLLLSTATLLRDGLLPSGYAEDGSAPLYRGADVSLWFINAVWQYLRYSADEATVLQNLLGPVLDILAAYRAGTGLGITVDGDGLLCSRAKGLATSWMDAKVGDWVITPRGGRPVELNALWYNALRIEAELLERLGGNAAPAAASEAPPAAAATAAAAAQAARTAAAFNAHFWNEAGNGCFDVVDDRGRDAAIRPNQLFAIALPFPVLSNERWPRMVATVRRELLTPFGLRTLSPRDPAYLSRYRGDVVARDRAYHNGSAFPWLLGPFVTAFLRVEGRDDKTLAEAREFLQPCINRIRGDGLGNLCELFDGEPPNAPGGTIASAKGVAEMLRCHVEDILESVPTRTAAPVPQRIEE